MKNRVLVTGSEGFVGKILCRYLNDKGYQVLGATCKLRTALRIGALAISPTQNPWLGSWISAGRWST